MLVELYLVVLLGLTVAFDKVDHQILLDRLLTSFNITGVALRWIRSYLRGRSFRVSTGGDLSVSEDAEGSENVRIDYGVPQGSVLGPLYFVLYTNYIGNIILQHGIKYHVYVDDIQLHISFDPKDENASNMALVKLSACINDIHY